MKIQTGVNGTSARRGVCQRTSGAKSRHQTHRSSARSRAGEPRAAKDACEWLRVAEKLLREEVGLLTEILERG